MELLQSRKNNQRNNHEGGVLTFSKLIEMGWDGSDDFC